LCISTIIMDKNYNNNGLCSNCGKFGHFSYQCNFPIISFGLIVYRDNPNTNKKEYLMICRKDSFGYVDFIRGKYNLTDITHIRHLFREMSKLEHEKIEKSDSFSELWCDLWNIKHTNNTHKHEERVSRKKYEMLKNGIIVGDENTNKKIYLTDIINGSSSFENPEWEFPKGRKELNETEIGCALREFEEETGVSKKSINLVGNLSGFDENYIATNYTSYKHRYFLGKYIYEKKNAYNNVVSDTFDVFSNFQKSEVGKIEWKTLEQCLKDIRTYHLEKKNVLKNIDTLLHNYTVV